MKEVNVCEATCEATTAQSYQRFPFLSTSIHYGAEVWKDEIQFLAILLGQLNSNILVKGDPTAKLLTKYLFYWSSSLLICRRQKAFETKPLLMKPCWFVYKYHYFCSITLGGMFDCHSNKLVLDWMITFSGKRFKKITRPFCQRKNIVYFIWEMTFIQKHP